MAFILNWKQFPIRLSYGMIINKSQGQTLDIVVLYLPRPLFTHEQMYVALSRVKLKKGLKIFILDEEKKERNEKKNIVYTKVFQNYYEFSLFIFKRTMQINNEIHFC